ncbi:MAG TPA: hypothetical protein VKR32_15810 [Puia sp.]|nr:hypothetical protein [Puia sp.]
MKTANPQSFENQLGAESGNWNTLASLLYEAVTLGFKNGSEEFNKLNSKAQKEIVGQYTNPLVGWFEKWSQIYVQTYLNKKI